MKKKIIALAIAAAISAPAFADTTVYGVLDAGYGKDSKKVGVTEYTQSAIAFSTMTSSRLGFVNTEDLGGGMSMAAKVETGIGSNPMAGFSQTGAKAAGTQGTTIDATSLGNRELNLTLNMGEGTSVKVGYGSTPIRDISLGYAPDPGGNLIGNILNNDAVLSSNRQTTIDVMHQFGPVKGTVSISKNSDTLTNVTGTDKNNGWLLGAQYAQDAVSASFAYQSLKSAAPGTAAVAATGIYAGAAPISATNPGVPYSAAVAAADTTQKTMILGASYDLGAAKVIGEYANIKIDDNLNSAAKNTKTYMSIGAQVPFGAILGFAQYSSGTVDTGTSVKIDGYTVGAKYNMSKATYGYVSTGSTDMKAGPTVANPGVKVTQIALGLVHTF